MKNNECFHFNLENVSWYYKENIFWGEFVRIKFDGDCVWSQILTWFAKAE